MAASSRREEQVLMDDRARGLLIPFILLLFPLAVPSLFAQEFTLSQDDTLFLEEVQKKAFDFFLHEHHPDSGLVKDKASNFTGDSETISSIAATGFGLTAMVVGAERGWISKAEAQSYAAKTLRFFFNHMESVNGFYYHFVNWETGKKTKYTELSSIDTALFLAGALTAGEYFKGTEVEALANKIYEKVDFPWMLNNGQTLSMGWHPNQGFLKMRWADYNESLILYLLAIGSPTHPIPADSWQKVNKRISLYDPYVLISSPPLFTHQYSAIWIDFRNKNDGLADYFENSRIATLVNRQFTLDHRDRFLTYSEDIWGLTASTGPNGYKAYGSEPGGAVHDGTIAPTAAGASIVFTPELSVRALKAMYHKFKDRLWGRYGFSDAFNLDRNWYSQEVLGIDQGPILLMIENYRSELIWELFMQHPAVIRGMERIGFRPGTLTLKRPEAPKMTIPHEKETIKIDGNLDDWDSIPLLELKASQHRELGEIQGDSDLSVKLYFSWDEDFLYMGARVVDDSFMANRKKDQIWKDDCLELFFDPDKDGMAWGNPKDVQLGFSPSADLQGIRNWAWFQGYDPSERGEITEGIQKQEDGYSLEAAISWKLLRVAPGEGIAFGLSPAFHDLDQNRTEGKLNWFMLNDGKSKRILLGRAELNKQSK